MDPGFEREKLYEALAFFTESVKYPGWIKLLKLVYYLDLVHLRRTGRTVTGLKYEAWPMGPVPKDLYAQIKDSSSELHRHFEIGRARKQLSEDFTPTIDTDEDSLANSAPSSARWVPGAFKARQKFQHRYLTNREYQIARELAEIFFEAKAEDMSDVSHQKFGPWRKARVHAEEDGIERPEIDLLQGIVACCDPKRELPIEQVRELIAEREEEHRALG
jgi:uncharacterized phage-associated protein